MAVQECTCGSKLQRIVFGLPESRDMEAGRLDDVVLGGCMVRGDGADPNRACPDCDRRYMWFRGHLFAEESWLAPIEVTQNAIGELRVVLRGLDDQDVLLHVACNDLAFVYFENFHGEMS